MFTRRAIFWLLTLAPLVLLFKRGRRLAEGLPGAAAAAILFGLCSGVIATAVFLVFFEWDERSWLWVFLFLGVIVHLVMSIAEAPVAAFVLARRHGRFAARVAMAFFGALLGHLIWAAMLAAVAPFVADANFFAGPLLGLILIPSALLGGSGAAVGAAILPPPGPLDSL